MENGTKNDPSDYDTEAFLVEVGNELDAQMIINVLKNEHIPCMRKYILNGDMLKIYGFVNIASKLYVPSKALERARELIQFEPMEMDDEPYEEPVETSLFDKNKWFDRILWLLGSMMVLIYILSLFNKR